MTHDSLAALMIAILSMLVIAPMLVVMLML